MFTGLEAETKTLAKLKVDIDPTLALEVATKQYVDHYSTYRRPSLVFLSTTTVGIQTGINGTSGQAQILFPDGTLRTDSTVGRIVFTITQNAVLSGTAQSGLRTGSVANNTWYAIYAVKTSDNTSNFVAVGDTVLPLQANYASLNSNFGTNSWVYLGLIRYGNNKDIANQILYFFQTGNITTFVNAFSGNVLTGNGTMLATTAAAASLTYTYAAGTGAAQIPANIYLIVIVGGMAATAGYLAVSDSAASRYYSRITADPTVGVWTSTYPIDPTPGVKFVSSTGNTLMDIALCSFYDNVLGVGSNPLL